MSCLIVASACLVTYRSAFAVEPPDGLEKAEVALEGARERASEIEALTAAGAAVFLGRDCDDL